MCFIYGNTYCKRAITFANWHILDSGGHNNKNFELLLGMYIHIYIYLYIYWIFSRKRSAAATKYADEFVYIHICICVYYMIYISLAFFSPYAYLNTQSRHMQLRHDLEKNLQISRGDVSLDNEMPPAGTEICRTITTDPWLMVSLGWGHRHIYKAQRPLWHRYMLQSTDNRKKGLSIDGWPMFQYRNNIGIFKISSLE